MSFPEPHDHPHDSEHDHPHDHSHNEQAAQKEQILKQILTPDARMRLNNIKMVKPELSDLVEQYLIGMASQGKMSGQITDDQLKQILLSTQQPKRDFKINRV
ncbi:MAG: DNA-binding protein [Thaumarchaeota archaeon]|nr:MAG: DNA-binding protein [Nitrososphaerota archaeon]